MRVALACLALCAAPLPASAEIAPAPAPYPAGEVLAAFATACSGVESRAVLRASVLAAGWTEIVPDPGSQVARLIAVGENEVKADKETIVLAGLVATKTVEGRTLFLVGSGVEIESLRSHGCRIFDFAAREPIPPEAIESWAVRKPSHSESREGITRHVWNPGLKPGHMEMEVAFVAHDSPIRQEPLFSSLSGLAFIATAMEPIDK